MSYTEYLRRKAAAAPVIIDSSPRKVDASHYTTMARMKANATFFTSSRVGVINNVQDPSRTGTHGNSKQVLSYTKTAGGRVPDASSYTSFAGGNAIREDIKADANPAGGRYLLNSNNAGSLSACVPIAGPAPFTGGAFAVNNVPMTGSGFLNNTKHCQDLGRVEPHTPNELGPSLFVDTMRPAKPASNTCSNGAAAPCKSVIHTHPAVQPRASYQARPQRATIGPELSKEMPYVVGNVVPSKHLKYVEKHHGNPTVNRRVPTKYQIPAGAPAHLKINDPQAPKVPFSS